MITHEPMSSLDRLLDPVTASFNEEALHTLVSLRADESLQLRMEQLADRNTEGELSEAEKDEYQMYVHAVGVISLLQAKARMLTEVAEFLGDHPEECNVDFAFAAQADVVLSRKLTV